MNADIVARYYNVGTGKRTSLKELAELLINLTGCNQPMQYRERSQATLVRNRVGSPDRAREEIGFESEVELKDGLRDLISWRASHKAAVAASRARAGA